MVILQFSCSHRFRRILKDSAFFIDAVDVLSADDFSSEDTAVVKLFQGGMGSWRGDLGAPCYLPPRSSEIGCPGNKEPDNLYRGFCIENII